MSVVTELEASLKTEFPALVVTATEGPLQDVRKLTLLIRRKSVDVFPRRAALASQRGRPAHAHQSPSSTSTRQPNSWTTACSPVLDWLDSRYLHEPASLVGWNGSRLAYDIPPATITAQKES